MTKMRKNATLSLTAVILVVSLGFYSFKNEFEFKILKSLDIFYSLFREVNMFYVDDIDPEELIKAGIDGMLTSLDPYTNYIEAEEKADFRFQTTGEYGGIGALIRNSGDYIIISEPYKGFPADKAGLKAGDRIMEIDGKNMKGVDSKMISENLKGLAGTTINVKIGRPSKDTIFNVQLTREKISINSVSYFGMLNISVGYIKLDRFTKDAYGDIKAALVDLKNKQKAKAIILDLRNNPGGLLNEAIDISSLFINKGQTVVTTKGRLKSYNEDYKTSREPVDTSMPFVVLINGASASASEIIAGCMQDLDRAVIVGEKSYGKGLVQSTRMLTYDAQVKITTARYYIPSGRCIQAIDYSHKDASGRAKKVPDSLIKEFKTRNGRSMKDAGGIMPDFLVAAEEMSPITISLYAKNHIFDYSVLWASRNDSILHDIDKFSLTDADFNNFKEFLKDKEFDYTLESEAKLKELINAAKEEKYYDLSKEAFNTLEKNLVHDKFKDMEAFKNDIMELLREEIVLKYYYESGFIRSIIYNDPQVKKCLEVLANDVEYKKMLKK